MLWRRNSVMEMQQCQTPSDLGSLGVVPFVDIPKSAERLGNDLQLLQLLIDHFMEDSPPLLKSLQTAMREGGRSGAESAAHRLKGMAANFSCSVAVAAAQRVEDLARAGQIGPARPHIVAVEQSFAQLRLALADYRRK